MAEKHRARTAGVGSNVPQGSVKPNEIRLDFHNLLGLLQDIEHARSPRLALCFNEKAMAAARNRGRSRSEARPAQFGLTIP